MAGTVSAGTCTGDFRLDGGDDGPEFEDWYRREFSRLVSVLIRLGTGPGRLYPVPVRLVEPDTKVSWSEEE
jgi:hypothetical protein